MLRRVPHTGWSPFGPALVGTAAWVASSIRWYLQGSSNLYTAVDKRFYVPDPDLGWRISTHHPIWLGLDACAIMAIVALILTGVGVVIRRRERTRVTRARALRAVSWLLAASSICVPAVAFASGFGPDGSRDTLPAKAAVMLESGIAGSLDAPAGTYAVVPHAGTSVTAHLSAGGEVFDARFGDVAGTWRGTPRDLGRPMRAEIDVATASLDTGVGERSKHAREGYLRSADFPRVSVAFDRVAAVRAIGPREIVFRAPGAISLMGKTHPIEIIGSVAKLEPAALARLELSGDVLLVQANFTLPLAETALAPSAEDFDGERIPVHVSLVLRHTGDPPRGAELP